MINHSTLRSMTIRPENCLRMDDLRMRSYYDWKSKPASFTQLFFANEKDPKSFKLLTFPRTPTVISHFKRRIAFPPADQSVHTFSCFVWGVPSVYVWSMNWGLHFSLLEPRRPQLCPWHRGLMPTKPDNDVSSPILDRLAFSQMPLVASCWPFF